MGELAQSSKILLALRNPDVWSYSYDQKRPRLPAPHQIGAELYDTVIDKKVTSKRSLVFHGSITIPSFSANDRDCAIFMGIAATYQISTMPITTVMIGKTLRITA